MKKIISLLAFTILALGLHAKPNLQSGRKYQIMSEVFPAGCVTVGSLYDQTTPVYYLLTAGLGEDCYWYFTEEEPGYYSIRNAQTGEYVTYTGERSGNDIRYVRLTSTVDEDDAYRSLWTISVASGNYFTIRNAAATTHIWDVRTDTHVVGTYESKNVTNNQRFAFYDEGGNVVKNLNETVSGYDVSSWFIATTDAQSDKWTNSGWSYHEGGNYSNGEASVVTPFYENWHESSWGPLADCSLSQTLSNLPAGSYTLQADMIAVRQAYYGGSVQRGTGVYLFVDGQTKDVGTLNNQPERYTINFTLSAPGSVTLGARAENTNANWIALDNLVLYYHTTEEDLLKGELYKLRADASAKATTEEIEAQIAATGGTFDELEYIRRTIMDRPNPDPLSLCASDITIKGRTPFYVKSLGLYLCSISEKHFGTDFTDVVAYTPKEGYGDMVIDGTPVESGATHTFSNVEAGKTYTISFSDGSSTVSYPLTFTSLPIVHINGSFSNAYSEGYIQVAQPNKQAAELLNMKAKWRGGITNGSGKHKRNYHVKLLDEQGEKLEKRYFDLRKDNSWILESCQVDMSRIRNRVLTDLWNDYRRPPYYIDQEPEAQSGTRGEFVELILNDDYRGIYCMTEAMDRKQMKLKKYDEATLDIHGQLWKSKDWSYAVFMGHNSDSNYYPGTSPSDYYDGSDSWNSYTLKYPDIDDVFPTDWSTLYNAVDFVCTASDDEFRAHAGEYFDLPVVIDYYILMETILSTDNHGKNMYFAVYDKQADKKITLGVWDMDATCGQRWSDSYYHQSFLGPEQDYAQFITQYEHGDYNLFRRLRNTDADNFNLRVAKRYRELRQNILATESILQRFRTYFDHFRTAGADQREYAKWSYDSDVAGLALNFDTEYAYIADWFTRRMQYLDEKRFDLQNLPPNGDANGDGVVTIADVTAIVNHILGKPQTGTFNEVMADTNGDGAVTIADVTATTNIILGKK